jgi:N-acetylglutamate synthase-like GNAT family acetyltransferase
VSGSPEGGAPGFSEREFYLREFRGRTLAIIVSKAEFAEPLRPVLDELAGAGARAILIAREARILELLGSQRVLRASDPRLEGNVWRALHATPRIGIVVARAEDFGDHARELACKLGVFKLVWLDPDGGMRTRGGERLAFVHRAELAELLAEPRRLQTTQRLRLWREIADMLDAGLSAINVCAPEGLGDELFTYAGSGTLFTRERYVTVRALGVDDFDAAYDLLRRGVEEGYLAPRDDAEVDALLAAGFGSFVEGRDLAGIGSLLPSLDGNGAEIAGLYTLTRFLGEGVGFSLVAHALAEAERRGLAYVFACTVSERVGAFFERNDFRAADPREVPAEKWRDYDPARRERVRCYRRELGGGPALPFDEAPG